MKSRYFFFRLLKGASSKTSVSYQYINMFTVGTYVATATE